MVWDIIGKGIGTALGGPLGGALGDLLGGALSNKRQAGAAQQATGALQGATAEQLASIESALGLQQGSLAQGTGLQRELLDEALGRAGGQGDAVMATLGGLYSPYTTAGAGALGGLNQYAQGGLAAFNQQQALTGALGPEAQAAAYASIQGSPAYQAAVGESENAILQNASATGGLRGGNVQMALAKNRPLLLDSFVQRQFGNLGGLAALGATNYDTLARLGQGSATGQAQGALDVLRGNSGLLGTLYGGAAGNAAGLENNFMDNAAALAGQTSGLLGQRGSNAATGALLAGKYGAGNTAGLGSFLGTLLQQGAQFGTRTGAYAGLR